MTLVDVGTIFIPPPAKLDTSRNLLLDAANEKAAFVLKIPKTGTLKKICFRTGTVTVGDTVDVRIETVSNGEPSGTLYDASATGSQAVGDSDDDTSFWVAINGSTGISVTVGDVVAIVLAIYYVDGVINIRAYSHIFTSYFPYAALYNGSWALYAYGGISLEYDGEIVTIPGHYPACAHETTTANTATSPDSIGNRFLASVGCRVVGLWANIELDYGAYLDLYDSDGVSLLASVLLSRYERVGTVDGLFFIPISPVTLTKDNYYRIVIRPSTSSTITIPRVSYLDDGALKGINAAPMGEDCVYTYATNTPDEEADWTQDTTRRCLCGIIVDQIDVGSAASGILGHRGMTGGLQ